MTAPKLTDPAVAAKLAALIAPVLNRAKKMAPAATTASALEVRDGSHDTPTS
jgi:hypothetical protein